MRLDFTNGNSNFVFRKIKRNFKNSCGSHEKGEFGKKSNRRPQALVFDQVSIEAGVSECRNFVLR